MKRIKELVRFRPEEGVFVEDPEQIFLSLFEPTNNEPIIKNWTNITIFTASIITLRILIGYHVI